MARQRDYSFADIPEKITRYGDRDFVRDLLRASGEYNVSRVNKALEFDIDRVYFGDDWAQ